MLRVAIVGCGRIVEEGHLPALRQLADRFEPVAVADPTLPRRERIGELAGLEPARRFADHRALLDSVACDLVDVAVPHVFHEQIVLDCLAAGRHVVCEKPLAPTLDAADRMIAAARAAGRALAVFHNYRFMPAVAAALRLVRDGAVGQPFFVRWESLGAGHWPGAAEYDPAWRTRRGLSGGGCLLDNGYHSLYLIEALMGAPAVSVSAAGGTFVQPIEVDDLAVLTLRHASGGISTLQVSWAVRGGAAVAQEVHGERGSLHLWRGGRALSLHDAASGEWRYPDPPPANDPLGFVGSFRELADAFAAGTHPPVDGAAGRRVLELVVAGYAAMASGGPVAVAPAAGAG